MRRHRLRTLRNICLPGSHQSATYMAESTERHLPLAIGWTRCQQHDIAEQLDAGIRFLDLGVTSTDHEFGDGEVGSEGRTTPLVRLKPNSITLSGRRRVRGWSHTC